jgi:hypothetical protein
VQPVIFSYSLAAQLVRSIRFDQQVLSSIPDPANKSHPFCFLFVQIRTQMGLGPGVASLPLHPAQQVAVRCSDPAHPNYSCFFYVQSFCKYANLVKFVSLKP